MIISKRFVLIFLVSFLTGSGFCQYQVELPFLFERNQIIVQVKINDKGPFYFLFDTGTNPSTINKEDAEIIGLKLDTIKREGVGYGENPIVAYLCYLPKIQLGKIKQDSLLNVALNLSSLKGKFSIPVIGVLGYSFLKGRRFMIDYPKRKIIFYKNGFKGSSAVLINQAIEVGDNESTPVVDGISFNGYKVKLIFDTGSSLAFNLSHTVDSLYNFSQSMLDLKSDTLEGYGGKAISYSGKIKSFKWGKLNLTEVKMTIDPNKKSDIYRPVGSIGNEFLKSYKVYFDYVGRKVIIMK